MTHQIPTVAEVQALLAGLSLRELEDLAERSGVPMTTIYKIRNGVTTNPGIDTVRRFIGHVSPPDCGTANRSA